MVLKCIEQHIQSCHCCHPHYSKHCVRRHPALATSSPRQQIGLTAATTQRVETTATTTLGPNFSGKLHCFCQTCVLMCACTTHRCNMQDSPLKCRGCCSHKYRAPLEEPLTQIVRTCITSCQRTLTHGRFLTHKGSTAATQQQQHVHTQRHACRHTKSCKQQICTRNAPERLSPSKSTPAMLLNLK